MIRFTKNNTLNANQVSFRNISVMLLLLLGAILEGVAQNQKEKDTSARLVYFEADPFAYINKGYSLHLGYENRGWRLDFTKVKVDFPENFEKAFYGTEAFDLVTRINGIKIDYFGQRSNWTKGAFIGLDINAQQLNFTHRETLAATDLSTFNIGLRTGYKIKLIKGFYVTPWAAVWKNVSPEKSFSVNADEITTNQWDWIATLHFGYALKF